MEEQLSNDESEFQVLRQQLLEMTRKLSSAESEIQELTEKLKKAEAAKTDLKEAPVSVKDTEKVDSLTAENLKEFEDLLIRCISQNLGYSNGKPVAASVIYKCLLHWRSFEVERTTIFNRIIQTIGSAIEAQDNIDMLAYWLSNTSSLLLLLQRTLKTSGSASFTLRQRRSASLFGRMCSLRSSSQNPRLAFPSARANQPNANQPNDVLQVEAKYPALLFKQQLTDFLNKIYRRIRDNLKKEISRLLALCIQAPRTSRASKMKGQTQANSDAQQALIAHWQSIVESRNNYLMTMKSNNVPPFLVRKIFSQTFYFVNVQLFNSLLLRRECCSFNNGEFVTAGLAMLEQWCYEATDRYCGSAWDDELKNVRQAVAFLVTHQKPKKTLNVITHDLCPALSVEQLYRLSTMYWDDKYGTHSVSDDVISCLIAQMTEDGYSSVSNSFLLEDHSRIPFSLDDIYSSMQQQGVDDMIDIHPPELLRTHTGFLFLTYHPDR